MNAPKTSFEVQVLEDKHWVIAEMAVDEDKAKAFAENLLQAGNHAAVRVVKDYQRIDGTHTETVLLEKQAAAKGPSDPTLANITSAPLCAELEDFYSQPARVTIGKLLRKYLDEALVTPTELLHDAKEMKRFGDKGNLLFGAIDKVSGLQAKAAGDENSKARKDFLDKSWEQLLARVIREVGGTNPLSRNDPAQEFEMFHKMLHRLVDKDTVTGGPPLAESLLQRGSRVLNSGGATVAAPQALQLLLGAMADGCVRLQFLLTLCASSLGKSMGEVLTEVLDNHVRRSAHIDQWIAVRLPPPARMAALTAANKSLKHCPVLAEEFRKPLAELIDEVMVRYLTEEGIIEKVDKPDDPLAARAVRLVKFCGAGVLIDGKSLNMAKARVIEHLRQKQFEEKFVASCPDPSQGEKNLRDFHKLLVECGFG